MSFIEKEKFDQFFREDLDEETALLRKLFVYLKEHHEDLKQALAVEEFAGLAISCHKARTSFHTFGANEELLRLLEESELKAAQNDKEYFNQIKDLLVMNSSRAVKELEDLIDTISKG